MIMKQHQVERLITITRNDISSGYQIAQSGHAIAQFFLEHPELSKQWNNNYLISLSIDSEQSLYNLLEQIENTGTPVSYFREPDIGHELTSLCFIQNDKTKKITHKLKLSLN